MPALHFAFWSSWAAEGYSLPEEIASDNELLADYVFRWSFQTWQEQVCKYICLQSMNTVKDCKMWVAMGYKAEKNYSITSGNLWSISQ